MAAVSQGAPLSPQEILKRVRRIEIRTRRFVNDIFAGEYSSVFKGRGMDFAEVREYQPGDDVRTIDWNVTARMRKPYVKKFVEERELKVMLVVDGSGSMAFGTRGQLKRDLITELCAVVALAALKNNDKVGLILFTDVVEKFVPPRKGRKHALRVIREVLYFQPQGQGTNITSALDYLNHVARRHAVVFLISDFQVDGYETALKMTSKRHDLVTLIITDPLEGFLPPVGFLELYDAETAERVLLDTRRRSLRHWFEQRIKLRAEERTRLFRSLKIDSAELVTGATYIEPLVKLFRERARRFR